MDTIGTLVMLTRESKGVSRMELAQRMGCKSVSTIEALENGRFYPTAEYLNRVATALDTTIDKLLPADWLSPEHVQGTAMTLNEYQWLAARTINRNLYPEQQAHHALHGMVGEIGELHSLYQKTYQGHDIDRQHLKKELGDLLWFIAEYATAMGWTLEDVAQGNIDKLRARYPEGFDADKSLHRKEGDI